MAPTKNTRAVSKQSIETMPTFLPQPRKGLTKRGTINVQDQNVGIIQTRGKRKAEHSPAKNDKVKRSALGNLTNNVKIMTLTTTGNIHSEKDLLQNQNCTKRKENNIYGVQTQYVKEAQIPIATAAVRQVPLKKIATRASTRNSIVISTDSKVLEEPKVNALLTTSAVSRTRKSEQNATLLPIPAAPIAMAVPPKQVQPNKPVRRISSEFNKTEESLYMSALEDVSSCESMRLSGNFEAAKRRSALLLQEKLKTGGLLVEDNGDKRPITTVPEGVEDFDKANWNDVFQVSHYAMDIFNYIKSREVEFPITDYIEKQIHLTKWMRTLLVDWMVEVQETFELNHETLYLAVKIVDIFLSRVVINKDVLQLLGASALFIACKFDERTPPLIEDFLYICDGAYKHEELIRMEMTTLRTINYDLGIPLSYRFLRRYARCAKISMPTLTLARYILELSLMDYDTIQFSDSKLASAALFIALRLHGSKNPWTSTLEYYSGYVLSDFAEIIPILNIGLHRKPKVKTIRSKYSHKIFYEVAKVALLSTEQLFENILDLNNSIRVEEKKNL